MERLYDVSIIDRAFKNSLTVHQGKACTASIDLLSYLTLIPTRRRDFATRNYSPARQASFFGECLEYSS